jgi:glycosyltransferase involved in cell wall biosynthesis
VNHSSPQVSVILPTYNRRQHLPAAIASITQQTYTDYELIIVDDGSTDDTVTWLQTHHPQIRLIPLSQNQGAAAARNAGVRQARGQYIAFLDSDDQWVPNYLKLQMQALTQHPQALLTYCDYIRKVPENDESTLIDQTPAHDDLIVAMLLGNFIHSLSQVVMPKVTFEKFGGLDEQFLVCHDRALYLRLFAQGVPVHVVAPLVQKSWLPDSLVTHAHCQTWLRDGLNLLEQFYRRPENDRYLPLRSKAEQVLRSRVQNSQQYFARVFGDARSASSEVAQKAVVSEGRQEIAPAEQYEFVDDVQLVTTYFNPQHYRTKFLNYQIFRQRIEAAGLKLLTVECAFGDDRFELAPGQSVLQVRCTDVMWQRERLLNLAIAQLPDTVTKVIAIDGDVLFSNPRWVVETSALLEQYPVVHPYQIACWLPQGQQVYRGEGKVWRSFGAVLQQRPEWVRSGNFQAHGHTGFVWAMRREVWRYGLYDRLICGGADHLVAHAMCGDFSSPCVDRHLGIGSPAWRHFKQWGEGFYPLVQGRVGVVEGAVLHLWHGNWTNRSYVDRHDVLAQYGFDPATDIRLGAAGVWEWSSDKPEMHQWMVEYFEKRREDGIK